DDSEKIKSDVAGSAKDDVVQKSGVVDGVKVNEDDGVINRDDIDKLKSDDVSVKASLVKKDDVMLKLRLNYGVFGGVKGNEDGKKKKEVVDLTDDDPVPQPKSATELDKWNPADFEYSLQNPLSIIDHNQLKELDPKSESALLVDFTQPTLQELATQLQIPGQEHGAQLQMHGEEDGALLAKKTLVDKEVTLGYFLVKAKYLENVKKLVKYEQNIDVCEKDDVDQQFTMQFSDMHLQIVHISKEMVSKVTTRRWVLKPATK
ncbi:hypothetical protein IFM89_020773, partial [Coptis chinensis]